MAKAIPALAFGREGSDRFLPWTIGLKAFFAALALAGVLAMNPRVLLLDEPSNGLDQASCERLFTCLLETGLPMLIASHDLALIARMRHRMLTLQRGRLIGDGEATR